MKLFLILAVVLCVVYCEHVPRKSHRGSKKYWQICANKSGLSKRDVKTLKEKSQFTLLTAGEQKFICCVAEPLIYDGKLVMERLQKIVTKKSKGAVIDLEIIKNECEQTGAKADNLSSCSKIATFAQCAFAKIRSLVNDHKHSINANANIATNANTTPVTKVDIETIPQKETVAEKETVAQTETVAQKEAVAQAETVTPKDGVAQTEAVDSKEAVAHAETVAPKEAIAQTEVVAPKEVVVEKEEVAPKEAVVEKEEVAQKEPVVQTDAIAQANANKDETPDKNANSSVANESADAASA